MYKLNNMTKGFPGIPWVKLKPHTYKNKMSWPKDSQGFLKTYWIILFNPGGHLNGHLRVHTHKKCGTQVLFYCTEKMTHRIKWGGPSRTALSSGENGTHGTHKKWGRKPGTEMENLRGGPEKRAQVSIG